MPESMSVERRSLLRALGASLVLTPAAEGMRGAISERPNWWRPAPTALCLNNSTTQPIPPFTKPPRALKFGKTLGMISMSSSRASAQVVPSQALSRYIKKLNPNFKAIAVEPKHSPVISGGQPGKHRIQGIGAGFVPRNLDTSIIDDVIQVDDEVAFEWGRRLAKEEGIMAGISSGANMWAAAQVAARPEFKGKRIVTIMCSLGERYLSTPLFGDVAG